MANDKMVPFADAAALPARVVGREPEFFPELRHGLIIDCRAGLDGDHCIFYAVKHHGIFDQGDMQWLIGVLRDSLRLSDGTYIAAASSSGSAPYMISPSGLTRRMGPESVVQPAAPSVAAEAQRRSLGEEVYSTFFSKTDGAARGRYVEDDALHVQLFYGCVLSAAKKWADEQRLPFHVFVNGEWYTPRAANAPIAKVLSGQSVSDADPALTK